MPVLFCDIKNAIKGEVVLESNSKALVSELVIDSRKIFRANASLFFALKGVRQDGHKYLKQAYDLGVRNFVVSEMPDLSILSGSNVFLVENVLDALQSLAKWHRGHFKIPVIGITGSNGKTVVKEWLSQMMSFFFRVTKSPKSFNSQIGVPLSVWNLNSDSQVGIFEAGISLPGEMEKLSPIIDCDYGIFTILGDAHDEGFSSKSQKLAEKLLLFSSAKVIFCNADQKESYWKIRESFPEKEIVSYGSINNSFEPDLILLNDDWHGKDKSLHLKYKNIEFEIITRLTDKASIENILMVCLVALYFNLPVEKITEVIRLLQPVEMRMEMKSGIHQSIIINDSYNSDITSLKAGLDFAKQQGGINKMSLIISELFEIGQKGEELLNELWSILQNYSFFRIITIGKQLSGLEHRIPSPVRYYAYDTTAEFLADYDFEDFSQETILVKGSRAFGLEKVVERLELKTHRTVLQVDLDAMRNNINVFASRLNPETKLLVMVKASGYGSGSEEIGRLLEYQKVDYLAVAYADEGIELRKSGISLPILVLNTDEASFQSLLDYRLEPEIFSFKQLKSFLEFLDPKTKDFPIHIKFDTGMHRLGFEEYQLDELFNILKSDSRVKVVSVFSHLAASDEKEHDSFSEKQFAVFNLMYKKFEANQKYSPIRHILNSSGIIRFPGFQLDMVRLGIGLYGVEVPNEIKSEVKPVLQLKTFVSQIKEIEAGETIGYGRRGRADKKMKIATIGIGYADGFLRIAGNGNYSVLVNGILVPTIGNICMDMCMIDVTTIESVQEGDEVFIFGKSPTADQLARVYNTIAYEVFTNISPRVKRVYFQEN
jgi:alanine racemase